MKNQVSSRFYLKEKTFIDIPSPEWKMTPESRFFCLGSCFADNFHGYFSHSYLNSFRPDFGPVYNPSSAASILNRLIGNTEYPEERFFLYDGRWRNFDFATHCTDPDKARLMERCRKAVDTASNALLSSDFFVLTVGTAFVYRHRERNDVVNNCHKLPSSMFVREFLSPEEVTKALAVPLKALLQLNPEIKIVLSVSPVRHLRDSPHDNTLSKSVLHLALNQLQSSVPHFYFPAYEILMDELRDYRWFADDLAHPSPAAVNYIMERFAETCGSDSFLDYLHSVAGFNRDLAHRIEFPESESAAKFRNSRKKRLESLKREFPGVRGLQLLELDA